MNGNGHQLERAVDGLWQCLSQDKRPLAVMIGAGCPVAVRVEREGVEGPLIPDVAGLTAAVVTDLNETELAAAMTVLSEGLAQDLGREPNVEDMLTRVRTLATVVGADPVRGLQSADINALEQAIAERISAHLSVSLPGDPTPYDSLAIWAGAIRRSVALNLFTTNYDLLAEEAFERNAVPFFDGFVGSRQPFLDGRTMDEDDIPTRWVRLWKLHGSTNWALLPSRGVVRRQPASPDERRLIHPSHLKYDESRQMPYLAMQDRLRAFLRLPSATLVTIGYSFSDDHINDQVVQGLRSNASAVTFALLFEDMNTYPQAASLAQGCPNLGLFARDRGCLSGTEAPWSNGADEEEVACGLGDFEAFGRELRRLASRGMREAHPDVG
ncbi:MAG: SIR2 family protein [Actinobacteria bacterium]|nr:SIR2 family protein [Actinomycetota bacterium]